MNYILTILCCLLFTGCLNWRGPHHPATAGELVAADSARAAWTAAQRPALGEACDVPIEIVTVEPFPEGRSPCVYIAEGRRRYGAACMRYVQPHVGAPRTLAIYLDADLDAAGRRHGIAHETLHHLLMCTGSGADAEHEEDPELWGAILTDAVRRAVEDQLDRGG